MPALRWTALLLGISSCATVRVPPHAAESRWGTVHAADARTAEVYAGLLDDVAPVVARALPAAEIRPVDLRVVSRISTVYGSIEALEPAGARFEGTLGTWIEIREDVLPADRPRVLAHELVHDWLGEAWKPLSPAVEDGLADLVGAAVGGEDEAEERCLKFILAWTSLNGPLLIDARGDPAAGGWHGLTISIQTDAVRMGPADVLDAMNRDLDEYHAIGGQRSFSVLTTLATLAVRRLTIDELLELCAKAQERGLRQLPAAWICEAAGLDPQDRPAWNSILLGLYGTAERDLLVSKLDLGDRMARYEPDPSGVQVSVQLSATLDL